MMKALVWHGKHSVSVDTVPEPRIKDPKDVIVRITSTAICGSDLHLYDGMMPTMEDGDIIGHEPMGEVVEVGAAVTKLKKGDGYGARRYGPVTRRTVWIFTHAAFRTPM